MYPRECRIESVVMVDDFVGIEAGDGCVRISETDRDHGDASIASRENIDVAVTDHDGAPHIPTRETHRAEQMLRVRFVAARKRVAAGNRGKPFRQSERPEQLARQPLGLVRADGERGTRG